MNRLGALAVTLAVAAVVVWCRAAVGAREQLAAAKNEHRHGQEDAAVISYGRAARWAIAPFASQARRELRTIALSADRKGNAQLARAAWSELRQAILATRWLVIADKALLKEANRNLLKFSVDNPVERLPGALPLGSFLSIIGLSMFIGATWHRKRWYWVALGMTIFVFGLAIA